ncbi:hypothetical protein ES703_117354 [subsurface metagenome]
MAEFTEHYDNMEQRNTICKDYASRGLRCLYDTFDSDWKRGDEPHGTLTFTNEPAPVEPEPNPEPPIPVRDLAAELDDHETRIQALEQEA